MRSRTCPGGSFATGISARGQNRPKKNAATSIAGVNALGSLVSFAPAASAAPAAQPAHFAIAGRHHAEGESSGGRIFSRQKRVRHQQAFEAGAAVCAGEEMGFDRCGIGGLAVVVKDELIFVQVFHRRELIRGSSATRIFRTARKILCFAALVWSPRTCPTSSMDIPSK